MGHMRGGEAVEDEIRESGGAHGVVINIEDLATSMEESMENQPKQLKTTAADRKCTIFRIPRNLEAINPQAYHPRIVSIGPYHHGKPELGMMEEHKWRLMKALLARSEQNNGGRLRDYLKAMAELEDSARACYSEEITTMNSEQFVRMLLLDGCFLVELFLYFEAEWEDPIVAHPWLIAFLARDFLRLENQLPLFVLQRLFDLSNVPNVEPKPSFPLLAIKFFSSVVFRRPKEAMMWSTLKERSHLLDLFRATFISPHLERRARLLRANSSEKAEREEKKKRARLLRDTLVTPILEKPKDISYSDSEADEVAGMLRAIFFSSQLKESEEKTEPARLLHSVTKLVRAGIEFRSINEAKTFLDIKFESGVLMIPHLKINDFASSFLQNCIAFEQSHMYSGYFFTSFATFMDCLIDTEKDVSLLVDAKVIKNRFGKDEEVANFFNILGRDVLLDLENCYLAKELKEVNRYYANPRNVMWAQFKNTYFSTTWSFISVMAALILLILTLTQTAFAIYPYYHPRK